MEQRAALPVASPAPQDPPPATDTSVVICAYAVERWDRLVRAVRSVEDQLVAPRELIIVIDHAPALLGRARRAFGGHRVMPNGHDAGLSGARNTGVDAARGSLVAFLDDDAAARPDWLERLTDPLADPAVVAVGGRVRPEWAAPQPPWFPDEFLWVVGCSYRGLPVRRATVRNPIGASMAMRRSRVLEVGGYASSLGRVGVGVAGCEETELSIRLTAGRQGARVEYEPAAVVDHHVGADRGTWRYFRRRCYGEGVSKARVALLAGARAGLSSERSYVLRTLVGGLVRRDDARAGAARRRLAIVAGTGCTVLGYVGEQVRLRRAALGRTR